MQVIGQRFGRLIVKDNAPRHGYVLCQCDCGKVKEIRKDALTRHTHPTRSCGCIHPEIARRTGTNTIAANSKRRIEMDVKYHSNFGVIESDKPSIRNRSGHKGVWWDPKRKQYEVSIWLHYKKIHVGRYRTYEEAVEARVQAEEKYFLPLIEKKREDEVNGG